MSGPRGSLGRMQPVTPMSDDELRNWAAKLWHQTGTIMVKPDWIADPWARQHALNVAVAAYGKRRVHGDNSGTS